MNSERIAPWKNWGTEARREGSGDPPMEKKRYYRMHRAREGDHGDEGGVRGLMAALGIADREDPPATQGMRVRGARTTDERKQERDIDFWVSESHHVEPGAESSTLNARKAEQSGGGRWCMWCCRRMQKWTQPRHPFLLSSEGRRHSVRGIR